MDRPASACGPGEQIAGKLCLEDELRGPILEREGNAIQAQVDLPELDTVRLRPPEILEEERAVLDLDLVDRQGTGLRGGGGFRFLPDVNRHHPLPALVDLQGQGRFLENDTGNGEARFQEVEDFRFHDDPFRLRGEPAVLHEPRLVELDAVPAEREALDREILAQGLLQLVLDEPVRLADKDDDRHRQHDRNGSANDQEFFS